MSKDLALQQVEWDLHENPETFIPLEFTGEIKPEIYGLDPKEANQLTGGIDVITAELKVLKNAYVDVIELEISTENLPIFKDLRKNFTKNRTSREKLRKAKKSYFLNGGRFVDAIFKNIDAECELMESKLLEAEKFFENLEKQKAKDLNDARIEKIRPYVEDVTGLDFSPMTDEDFDDYLLGKKTRFENEQKERAKAEQERLAEIEKQKRISENRNALLPFSNWIENFYTIDFESVNVAEVLEVAKELKANQEAEAEAQRIENERLRREAEEKEAQRQAELQAKKDAEIKAENERIESEKIAKIEAEKLAKAPIKKQLTVWVDGFEISGAPIDNATSQEIQAKFTAFKKWAQSQINAL
jgi:colicin import membrane protein